MRLKFKSQALALVDVLLLQHLALQVNFKILTVVRALLAHSNVQYQM